jgi:hypothetical protein
LGSDDQGFKGFKGSKVPNPKFQVPNSKFQGQITNPKNQKPRLNHKSQIHHDFLVSLSALCALVVLKITNPTSQFPKLRSSTSWNLGFGFWNLDLFKALSGFKNHKSNIPIP